MMTSKPATMTQSVQTTIPTNQYKTLRLSNNRVNKTVIYITNKMV